MFYRLDKLSVVDLIGTEADKILHNLTTNHVRALEPSTGCETFITEVRGKILGHVLAYRTAFGYRMIGALGQSERIVAHVDRYTIREDSEPSVLDDQWCGMLLPSESLGQLTSELVPDAQAMTLRYGSIELAGHDEAIYGVNWLGAIDSLLLVERERADEVASALESVGLTAADESAFHRRRTIAGVPWYGLDLDESNLPQEADRDAATICFTKGCYLGQETIARLDALGQVQKKLVRWSLDSTIAAAGMTLSSGEKTVARLTSVAVDDSGQCIAIAMTRRSHFDTGSRAEGVDAASGATFTGQVN